MMVVRIIMMIRVLIFNTGIMRIKPVISIMANEMNPIVYVISATAPYCINFENQITYDCDNK